MIDNQVKQVAEEFVQYLKSSQPVKEFQSVEGIYMNNPEVKKMREEYISVAQMFQKKQSAGTLNQEDINVIRKLQTSLSRHPATMQYAQAQQDMIAMLQDCNDAMSEVLGFDFSATAAPAASC